MSLKKRGAGEYGNGLKRHTNYANDESKGDGEDLVFEDPFGDDMEDEEMIESDDDDDEEIIDGERNGDDEDMEGGMDDEDEEKQVKKVFMPGVDKLGEDEVLDYDSSAYDMYYAMTAEWPSLSFDIVRDNLGAVRTRFPMTVYVVAGSQAANPDDNQVTIMKMSELHKTKHNDDSDDDSDNESDDEDNVDGDPVLENRSIQHKGGVNRIRSMPQSSNIVATWSDTKKVHLWDISKQLESLDGKATAPLPAKQAPLYTFNGHADEGFAMDWSPVQAGKLVTGDCSKFIYLWSNSESAWSVDKVPFTGHKGSVEDLQWSPTEASVFASCSADRTVRIWDTRRKAGSMIDVAAHDDDVNVISWNRNVAYLLASGSDDGSFKIWDMRNFKANSPVAHFRYHTAPITSIEWHPTDESVLAVSGADNQISVWDMSVEEDTEAAADTQDPENPKLDLPPQLLFIHQGQTDIKELHFHSQCPGVLVSTAGDGFNVFKPANIS
uniref:Glutamate-rich WD repeat-containing protein 1 n=1 Tax=Globisporangium ultimum (strain ATCC 200006 / CBS 805.95 / DAOM BR144) TaxID=431595 RepID=K3X1A2_GLOUD